MVELTAVNTDAVIDRVRAGEADIGFTESSRRPSGVRSRTVATDDLVIAVGFSHPWARRRVPVGPDLLARTAMVRREAGSGSRQAFDDALRGSMGREVEVAAPALEVSSPAAARAAAASGLGPTAISRRAVADDLVLGRVVGVPTVDIDLRRPLRAIWTEHAAPLSLPARDLLALADSRRRSVRDRP